MSNFTKEAQDTITRLEHAAEHFGEVFDVDAITKAMRKHYEALGQPMPPVIAVANWEEGFKLGSDHAWDAARGAAWGAARGAAWGAARGAAWGAAWDAAWDAARDAAFTNVNSNDPAVLKFLEIEMPILEALENGLGIYFPMQDALIVCPVPKFRLAQDNQTLHSDKLPAIEWTNSAYYFLNGVRFDKALWESVTSRKMPFEDILKIEDIDQRKQAMRYGNVWDFVKFADGKEIATYTKIGAKDGRKIRYWLYKFPGNAELFPRGAKYMIYDDSMVGAAEQHMQGVPMEVNTVPEAMAWKQSDDLFTVTPEQWEALELDVHFT